MSRVLGTLAVMAALLFGLAGPGFGFFTALGLGSGSATTGDLQPIEVRPATTGTPSTLLQPGGTADLLLNLRNPNSRAVTVTSVAQGGPVTVVGGSGCTSDTGFPTPAGNSGVTVSTTTGLSISIPAGATLEIHLPAAAAMSTTSASGCQNASYRVPVTVTVQQ